MPHYRNGTVAKVGDYVVGKPYNTDRVIAGTLISLTHGSEMCNCMVQFVSLQAEPVTPRMARMEEKAGVVVRKVLGAEHGTTGNEFYLYECVDFGAVSEFMRADEMVA